MGGKGKAMLDNTLTRWALVRSVAAAGGGVRARPAADRLLCGGKGGIGTWYGFNESSNEPSTLEINGDGAWLFNGAYAADGEWSETDGGTVVLSAPLVSVALRVEGEGDRRTLVFAGEDPSRGNAPEISKSTFYATEEARDAQAEVEND